MTDDLVFIVRLYLLLIFAVLGLLNSLAGLIVYEWRKPHHFRRKV